MGSTEAIPCCCKQELYQCCLSVVLSATCTTGTPNFDTCSVDSDPPTTIEYSRSVLTCAASEEECKRLCGSINVSDLGDLGGSAGGFGGVGQSAIVACEATFLGDKKCSDPDECSGGQSLCSQLACGPCEPYVNGCAVIEDGEPCPPTPGDCPKSPCCTPPPEKLCCCKTIVDGCISAAYCTTCTEESSDISDGQNGTVCGFISSCDNCKATDGELLVSSCCSDSSAADPCHDCGGQVCCTSCLPSGNPLPCVFQKCVLPCGQSGQTPIPLCPCTIRSRGPCSGFNSAQFTNYGTYYNSAENRITSGFVQGSDGSYNLNTLLLFGYGYNQL